ncbi:MAG: nicotinate-nucleotide adenylyltransferase [Bacteroidales bacterium]|nr:nicotinate-nucleotide adenylyltransferase [Bacteroidales bacterium]
MKHIGLFFGSFNPIHVGHLIVANSMLELTDMDQVWFVVSPQNPLKERRTLLADHHRLQMVREAIEDNYRMRASDVEFHLPVPSYTVVTLAHLSEQHPDKRFSLIMGGDNLENFRRWRNYEHILEHYHLYVYPRPGSHPDSLADHPHVHLVDVPMMDISSSYIRQQVASGHPPKYLLTEPVFNYLTEMHFYEKPTNP